MKHFHMNDTSRSGAQRVGMHQKSIHEFIRGRMTAAGVLPKEEDAEEQVDSEIPAEMAAEIPETEETEEKPAAIAADTEIEAAVDESGTEGVEDSAGMDEDGELIPRNGTLARRRMQKIPVLSPKTGGTDCEARELIYDRGDGSAKEIELPEVVQEAIEPEEKKAEKACCNVAALPEEPEPEPEPEAEPEGSGQA